jgi:carbamoyltransferase
MKVLGLSAFYHDSAACLVGESTGGNADGGPARILAAAEEERFSRKKHDSSFPAAATAWCLREAGIKAQDLDAVAFYEKPLIKFERILESHLAFAPSGFRSFAMAMPRWIRSNLWIKDIIAKELDFKGPILFPEHHLSHGAAAFFPSPFPEAAVLTMDGVGEWATTSYGTGRGNRLTLDAEIRFPHSLGLLYTAFTYYLGFKVNSGEYKVMGLAPYGRPTYKDRILGHLIDLREDGSFRLDMSYFNFGAGLTMTNARFHALFGGPPLRPETAPDQRAMDLARSIQEVLEEAVLRMGRHVHERTGMRNLCLGGGVALNCVANGRLLREGPFDALWIQPAAGDAGGAVGAALAAWHHYLDKPRMASGGTDAQAGSFLGPAYAPSEIKAFLDAERIPYRELAPEEIASTAATLIDAQKVVGWVQGRMEFGPRALGARSILADARNPKMRDILNERVKYRESFRPFAAAVLREKVATVFELDGDSPYMLLVAPVRKPLRAMLPSITHADGSARIQTVDESSPPAYRALLREMDARFGCPVVINTSFNVRGEPMVCSPQEAYACFRRARLDHLFLENFLLTQADLPPLPDSEAGPVELD